MPYTYCKLNKLESRGILVAAITIYCGLYYLTKELTNQAGLFYHNCRVNCLFLSLWLKQSFESFAMFVASVIPCLKKYLLNEDAFDTISIVNEAELKSSYFFNSSKYMSFTPSLEQVSAPKDPLALKSVLDIYTLYNDSSVGNPYNNAKARESLSTRTSCLETSFNDSINE